MRSVRQRGSGRSFNGLLIVLWLSITVVVSAQDSKVRWSQLSFEGNKVFSENELLDIAKKCMASGTPSGEEYERTEVEFCLRKIRFVLNDRGYLRATIGPLPTQTEDRPKFVIPIDEGVRYRLGEIRLIGSTVFSSAQLLEMLSVKPGDVVNGGAIAEWLYERANKAYANLGYIRYTAEPELDFRPIAAGASEGVVDLKIIIEEGNAFVVRSIKVEGNGKIPPTVLQRELLVKVGDVFNRERFEESLRKVDELELFQKIDPDKDVNYRVDRETPRLDITIRVKERKRTAAKSQSGPCPDVKDRMRLVGA